MTVVLSVVAIAVGCACLAFALSRRLGLGPASRDWAAQSEETARTTLLLVPGAGLLLLAAGFVGLADVWSGAAALVGVCALLGVPTVLYAGLRLPLPLWLFPRWARGQRSELRDRRGSRRRRDRAGRER